MPKDITVAAQERFAEGVSTGDFEVFDEVVHGPAPEQGPGPHGSKDMFGAMRSAFPDLQVTPEHMTAAKNDVALAHTKAGTYPGEFLGVLPTGRRATARGVQTGRFEDGRLAERWGLCPTSSPSSGSSARSPRRGRGSRRATRRRSGTLWATGGSRAREEGS